MSLVGTRPPTVDEWDKSNRILSLFPTVMEDVFCRAIVLKENLEFMHLVILRRI